MNLQLVEYITEDTQEATVRKLNQCVGQWRALIISVGVSPNEHLDSELFEET